MSSHRFFRKTRAQRARQSFRLGLEPLEGRQLLAGDVVPMGPLPAEIESRSDELPASLQEADAPHADTSAFDRFQSKQEFTEYILERAEQLYQEYPYPYRFRINVGMGQVRFNALDSTISAAFETSFVSGNVQVDNVDEADLIETDGRYLYVLSDRLLSIIDVREPTDLKIVSRTQLENRPTGMYLYGDRLTFIVQDPTAHPQVWIGGWSRDRLQPPIENRIDIYDIQDPATPTLLHRTVVDGAITSSRMVGSRLNLIVETPRLIPPPTPLSTDWMWATDTQSESLDSYLTRVRDAIPDMLPTYTTYDAGGNTMEEGQLVDVTDIYLPNSNSFNSLISVASLDVTDDSAGLLDVVGLPNATSSTVYMNEQNLYVAGENWVNGQQTVELNRFVIGSADGQIELAGATTLPGSFVSQFAMDEFEGYLRVATVVRTVGGTVNELHVLDLGSADLLDVGAITGIAPGETIRSVRFDGVDAYIVTFRQVDPFFTLDLSSPTDPQVVGELKVTGFSEHLRPIGDDLVIGFGWEANEFGWRQEPQISLFDVSDFSNPQLLDRYSFPDEAHISLWDHLSLTYVPGENLLAVPINSFEHFLPFGESPESFSDLYVFDVDRAHGFTLRTKVHHGSTVARSVVVDAALLSISETSVVATNLDSSEDVDRLTFAGKAMPDRYTFTENNEWHLDVLANDLVADGVDHVRIVDVSGYTGLNIVISDDGQSLILNLDQDTCSTAQHPSVFLEDDLIWYPHCGHGFFGPYFATYTSEDNFGSRSTTSFTVSYAPSFLAVDDWATVAVGDSVRIDVASNDVVDGEISAVTYDDSETRGTVALVGEETESPYFIYAAPVGFVGADSFRYAITNADGETSWANVQVTVTSQQNDETQRFVEYSVEITDADGSTVTQAAVGEQFVVNLFVQDTSADPTGAFAAFADVWFDPALVQIDGEIEYGEAYAAYHPGEAKQELGVIDELGGVAGITRVGGERLLVASVPFIATSSGTLRFVPDEADDAGYHETLVYGLDRGVPSENIRYLGASLEISPVAMNAADINRDGAVSPLDALLMIEELDRRKAVVRPNPTDSSELAASPSTADRFDINGDGVFSPLDPLALINALPSTNSVPRAPLFQSAQRADDTGPNWRRAFSVARRTAASDSVFAQLVDGRDLDLNFRRL